MAHSALDSVRAITFDMYGTLLDLDASFVRGIGRFLQSKGSTGDPTAVVRYWEASYLRESMADTILGRGRTPFERLRRDCLNQVLTRVGVSHTTDDVDNLLTTDAQVCLFPDVRQGLLALRERYTLAVLSNGDLESLERTIASLTIPVDQIISAEQAGAYKPHPVVYQSAVEQLGLEKEQILHVAAHPWDLRGAKACGLLGGYINRDNVPYGASTFLADLEVSKLTDLEGCLAEK